MCASYGKLAIFKEGDQSFTAYCYWKGQCYEATPSFLLAYISKLPFFCTTQKADDFRIGKRIEALR